MADVPALDEPEELKEGDHADDAAQVGNSSHDGAKVAAAAGEHRSREERDDEQDNEDDGVEDDRAERDDGNAKDAVDVVEGLLIKCVKLASGLNKEG